MGRNYYGEEVLSSMARVSPPLTISPQDRAVLEAMCTGNGEERIRAQIVLACEENKLNKDIAASLGVQSNMVSKWKEAYRIKGLDGIRIIHAGGRPNKYAEAVDIPAMIRCCLEAHPDWKADDIAKELKLPSGKIYYELGKMELNLQRSHRWTYSSSDPICRWNPPLILVYRAYECGTLVAFKSLWTLDRKVIGTLETRVRSMKEELEKSVVPVTLPGMLYTASRFVESPVSSNDKSPTEYVTKAIDSWCECLQRVAVEFHVFSFGKSPTYQGLNQVSCYYHTFDSEEEMASAFAHWMGGLCSGRQHIDVENLMRDLKGYGKSVKKETSAFVWYSCEPSDEYPDSGAEPDGSPGNESENPLDDKMTGWEELNLTQSEYKELMEAIGSVANSTDGDGTSVGVILYQTENGGGGRHFKLVQSDVKFQDHQEFDFSSQEGFTREISRLTEDSDDFGDSVAMANNDLFLEIAKKNKI